MQNKKSALLLTVLACISLVGCQAAPTKEPENLASAPSEAPAETGNLDDKDIELSLWTYPVGGW